MTNLSQHTETVALLVSRLQLLGYAPPIEDIPATIGAVKRKLARGTLPIEYDGAAMIALQTYNELLAAGISNEEIVDIAEGLKS